MSSKDFPIPTADDIRSVREHQEKLEASKTRHPELVRVRRPTVPELLQKAVCLKNVLDGHIWPEIHHLAQFTPFQTEEEIIYFPHWVGDGLHYITNQALLFADGHVQLGDTSEGCILFNLEITLATNHIPFTVRDLWNVVYPQDPITQKEMNYIFGTSVHYAEDFDPTNFDNLSLALEDLRAIRCDELAREVERLLEEFQGRR
jgi:hypothetical protein